MGPKKNNLSTIDEIYILWGLFGGIILAWDIVQFQNTGAEVDLVYVFQILILVVKDAILGAIVTGIYQIVKPIFKIIGL